MQNSSSNKSNGLLGIFSSCEEMRLVEGKLSVWRGDRLGKSTTAFVFIRLSLCSTK